MVADPVRPTVKSCFVHLRKPDSDMFRIALEIAQTSAENVLYIEDRPLFIQIAGESGITGIHHIDYHSTIKKLAQFGLKVDEPG